MSTTKTASVGIAYTAFARPSTGGYSHRVAAHEIPTGSEMASPIRGGSRPSSALSSVYCQMIVQFCGIHDHCMSGRPARDLLDLATGGVSSVLGRPDGLAEPLVARRPEDPASRVDPNSALGPGQDRRVERGPQRVTVRLEGVTDRGEARVREHRAPPARLQVSHRGPAQRPAAGIDNQQPLLSG